MSRPLIGVTTSEIRRADKPTDHGEPIDVVNPEARP